MKGLLHTLSPALWHIPNYGIHSSEVCSEVIPVLLNMSMGKRVLSKRNNKFEEPEMSSTNVRKDQALNYVLSINCHNRNEVLGFSSLQEVDKADQEKKEMW